MYYIKSHTHTPIWICVTFLLPYIQSDTGSSFGKTPLSRQGFAHSMASFIPLEQSIGTAAELPEVTLRSVAHLKCTSRTPALFYK